MVAVCDERYMRAKLRDRRRAKSRTRRALRKAFGKKRGDEILEYACGVAEARLKNDNQHIFGVQS